MLDRVWTWSVFGASLSFEVEHSASNVIGQLPEKEQPYSHGNDDWLLQRKVKIPRVDEWSEELGDSCCFGTRTVQVGTDCLWKLHGGV